MRIATWNVNSIRARHGRVVDWLLRNDVDVLAMQEIKCKPEQFPLAAFTEAGYDVQMHGLDQWNGVAIASRLPMTETQIGFPGMPGFGKDLPDGGKPAEARAIGVTVADLQLWSLYVPNGRSLENEHYAYKLAWLEALLQHTGEHLRERPQLPLALMGDWNIAPTAADMGDPSFVEGESTHVSPAERARFQEFLDAGFADTVRAYEPDGYTFWDYKAGRFPKNEGMRIDFILGNQAFTELVVDGWIDAEERKGDAPSDHVPVVVDLTLDGEEDDLDDRPMIF